MKKLASYGLAVLFALASVGIAVPASAAGPKVTVKVDRDEVRSGRTFEVTAQANIRCQWLVQWNGERRVATGKRFSGVFTAPTVAATKRLPLRATCFYTPAGPRPTTSSPDGPTQRLRVHVPGRELGSVVITVLPPKGAVSPPTPPQQPGTPGGLPNTGGPNWWLLLAGTATLAAGVVTVRRAARRDEV